MVDNVISSYLYLPSCLLIHYDLHQIDELRLSSLSPSQRNFWHDLELVQGNLGIKIRGLTFLISAIKYNFEIQLFNATFRVISSKINYLIHSNSNLRGWRSFRSHCPYTTCQTVQINHSEGTRAGKLFCLNSFL